MTSKRQLIVVNQLLLCWRFFSVSPNVFIYRVWRYTWFLTGYLAFHDFFHCTRGYSLTDFNCCLAVPIILQLKKGVRWNTTPSIQRSVAGYPSAERASNAIVRNTIAFLWPFQVDLCCWNVILWSQLLRQSALSSGCGFQFRKGVQSRLGAP